MKRAFAPIRRLGQGIGAALAVAVAMLLLPGSARADAPADSEGALVIAAPLPPELLRAARLHLSDPASAPPRVLDLTLPEGQSRYRGAYLSALLQTARGSLQRCEDAPSFEAALMEIEAANTRLQLGDAAAALPRAERAFLCEDAVVDRAQLTRLRLEAATLMAQEGPDAAVRGMEEVLAINPLLDALPYYPSAAQAALEEARRGISRVVRVPLTLDPALVDPLTLYVDGVPVEALALQLLPGQHFIQLVYRQGAVYAALLEVDPAQGRDPIPLMAQLPLPEGGAGPEIFDTLRGGLQAQRLPDDHVAALQRYLEQEALPRALAVAPPLRGEASMGVEVRRGGVVVPIPLTPQVGAPTARDRRLLWTTGGYAALSAVGLAFYYTGTGRGGGALALVCGASALTSALLWARSSPPSTPSAEAAVGIRWTLGPGAFALSGRF